LRYWHGGSFDSEKGAWDFIHAAAIAKRSLPQSKVKFFIFAPIPDRESLNWGWRGRLGLLDTTHPEDKAWELANQTGIKEHLVLAGRRPDILATMSGMDVVVACYRLHAMGRAAFEQCRWEGL
jgi:glycosyltransferase involved in cell wall biosynthesis